MVSPGIASVEHHTEVSQIGLHSNKIHVIISLDIILCIHHHVYYLLVLFQSALVLITYLTTVVQLLCGRFRLT